MTQDIYIHESQLKIDESFSKRESDLQKRLLVFSVNTLKFLMHTPKYRELDVVRYQLSKCATGMGAHFEEARNSHDEEYVQKLRVALCDANESRYWLRVLDELDLGELGERKKLMEETEEIADTFFQMIEEFQHNKKLHSTA